MHKPLLIKKSLRVRTRLSSKRQPWHVAPGPATRGHVAGLELTEADSSPLLPGSKSPGMARLLGVRLRRRLALCLLLTLLLYYHTAADWCLRCLYAHGMHTPKCHHVYARYAALGGPVVCMERHWTRAMHGKRSPSDLMGSFAFDRAVALGLRSASDEVAELGFNRTERVEQHLKQRQPRDWPLLPTATIEAPPAAAAAGLRRIEPPFTFAEPGATREPAGGSASNESAASRAGAVQWPPECARLRYSLFVPHHHSSGLPATIAAVGSAMAFGSARIAVVDTSGDQSAAQSAALAALGVRVATPYL